MRAEGRFLDYLPNWRFRQTVKEVMGGQTNQSTPQDAKSSDGRSDVQKNLWKGSAAKFRSGLQYLVCGGPQGQVYAKEEPASQIFFPYVKTDWSHP